MKKIYCPKNGTERELTDFQWSKVLENIEMKNDFDRESLLLDSLVCLSELDNETLKHIYFNILNNYEEKKQLRKALMDRVENMSITQLETCLNVSKVPNNKFLRVTKGVLDVHLSEMEEAK